MEVTPLNPIELEHLNQLSVVEQLASKPSTLKNGKIVIYEMKINNQLNPDIAYIEACVSTPIQRFDGEGKIVELMFNCLRTDI